MDAVLVLNAGSSSIKFSVFRDDRKTELLLRGEIEGLLSGPRFTAHDASLAPIADKAWPPGATLAHEDAIDFLFNWLTSGPHTERRIVAAGHRVVHGGTSFSKPVIIDSAVMA